VTLSEQHLRDAVLFQVALSYPSVSMNISKTEQRVLHVLAQGGHIQHTRDSGRKITDVLCVTRDGFILADCTLPVFSRLRRRNMIQSMGGGPYRISLLGRRSVRGQVDNQ
jgi:uncharacterized protein